MHVKRIHEMIEKLTECTKAELDKGVKQANTKEIGEVTDMIKDLCEAEYYCKIVKAMEESEEQDKKEEEYERMFYPRRRDSRGRFMGGRSGRYGFEEPPYMNMPMDMRSSRIMDGMSGYDGWERDMDLEDGRMYYSNGSGSGRGNGSGSNGSSGRGGNRGGNSGGRGGSNSGSGNSNSGSRSGSSSRYGFSHDEYLEKRRENQGNDPESKRERMKLLDEYLEDMCDSAKEVVEGMTPEEKQMWKSKITKILNM